jgi:hypothetical protein
VFDILTKGSKFNSLYLVSCIFPDLKKGNVHFHHRIAQALFWVHTENSMCQNGLKVASEFEKHYASRQPRQPYSPDTSSCDFWLFGMLKGVLKDREFNSSDEIKEVIAKVWDKFTFDEVQSVFHNWMDRLAWVVANEGEHVIE